MVLWSGFGVIRLYCLTMVSSRLLDARRLLDGAGHLFVLTGAGLSAEAGLPTYRGEGGLWSQVDSRRFTSLDAFENDPRTVWAMCSTMRERIAQTDPSPAHLAIARLALGWRRVILVTQNVDGLHNRAAEACGAPDPSVARAAELHGNLWQIRCLDCGHRCGYRSTLDPDRPPLCPECGGRTRPNIVWFGEEPHRDALLRALVAARECDICLVIGTSALVRPASKLPVIAATYGAPVIEINPEPTPLTDKCTVSICGKAGPALASLL